MSLFFRAAATGGTKGGEHIAAADTIRKVSVSILKNLQSNAWRSIEPKTEKVTNPKRGAFMLMTLSKHAIDPTIRQNTSIIYIPAWNVFWVFCIFVTNDPARPSVVIVMIAPTAPNSFGSILEIPAAVSRMIRDNPNTFNRGMNTSALKIPSYDEISSLFPVHSMSLWVSGGGRG